MKQDSTLLFQHASIFLVLYIVVILICGMFISTFNFVPVSEENDTSFLSSIIQSQVTIISIVITLSLVAIQITASQYSSTIVDYIRRHPDFWILITIYICLIIYGLIALITLNGDLSEQFLGISLRDYISLEFGIAVYSLIILVPYLYFTINLLSAKKIIDGFSKNIDKKSILNKDENFNFLFTIIRSSLLKNDLEVASYGLNSLHEIIIPFFKNSSNDEIVQINVIYVGKLTELQSLSQSMNFEFITGAICNFHYFVAKEVLENNLSLNLALQISALCEISNKAIEQNSNLVFNTSTSFLSQIAIKTSEKGRQEEYERALQSIFYSGQLSINHRNQNIFTLCINQLKSLALYQINKGSDEDAARVIFKFGILLDDAGLQNFFLSLPLISIALGEIETEIIVKNKNLAQSLQHLASHEKKVSDLVIISSQLMVLQNNITNLEKIYNYSIKVKNNDLSIIIIVYFHSILTNGIKSENRGIIILLMIQLQKRIADCYTKQEEIQKFNFYIEICRVIAVYLIDNRQIEMLCELLNNLAELEESLITKDFDEESFQLANLFYVIGKLGIEKKLFDFTVIAPEKVLKEMGYDVFASGAMQNKSPIQLVFQILHKSGVASSNKKLMKTTKSIIPFLGYLYANCAKEGYFESTEKIQSYLIDIGATSFEKGLKEAVLNVINQIEFLVKFSEMKEPKITLLELIRMDIALGCCAIEGKMIDVANLCASQIARMPDSEKVQVDAQFNNLYSQLTDSEQQVAVNEFKKMYQNFLLNADAQPAKI